MPPRRKKTTYVPPPPPPPPTTSTPTNRYGLPIAIDLDDRTLELACFLNAWEPHQGGLGPFGHFKRFCQMTWPDLEWNPWLETAIKSLCDLDHEHRIGSTRTRFVSWTGCGGAGKTFAAGLFATVWWLASDFQSCVTLTSTSKTIIGQRVWPVIQRFAEGARDPKTGDRLRIGHLVNSRKMLFRIDENGKPSKSEKETICAVAVEAGEISKALDKIKGRHCDRMMLIVDEANTTPNAIFECVTNMAKGATELIVLVIGNAESHLDNHGRACQPLGGWTSITVDDEQWETAGVKDWGLPTGICVHFDGEKSPNVRQGRTTFPYIYTYENHLADARWGRESARYWSQTRGFWPPEGILSTVFSESMLDRFDARGVIEFVTQRTPCAFMDTAFGGDRCRIQIGEIGDRHDGFLALQLTEAFDVTISVKEKHEVDYQVAHAFINACRERGIKPEYAGLDATGTGRGVAAIVMSEWSDQVHYIEWGGKASELPASQEDPRPGTEVYQNRVAELWYACRELLYASLIKGFCNDAIVEFTQRLFEIRGRKITLETKDDLRERLHRSCDAADAVAGLVEIARRWGVGGDARLRPDTFVSGQEATQQFEDHASMRMLDEDVVATSEMEW